MSRLGFQEKMLWGQLVGIVVVVVYYGHFLQHSKPGHHYFHALVLVLLFLFATVRTVARKRSGSSASLGITVLEDERDQSIAAMGARWSNVILWLGLVVILVMYWDHGSMRSANFLIAVLFHLLVLAGLARIVRELVAYRRSA